VGLTLAGTNDGVGVAARQFSTVKYRFKDTAGLEGQSPEPDLLFRPQQNAGAQAIGLNPAFHEVHLVNADREEELREFSERFFAQGAAPVQVIAAGLVAIGEEPFVLLNVARKAAGDRPDCTGIEQIEHHRVRHQPGYTAVAIHEGMYP
jgi:hypothetical protein